MIFSRSELPTWSTPRRSRTSRARRGSLAATIDKTVFPGVQGGPLMQVIAGKAVAFQLAAEELPADQQGTSRTPR